MANQIDFSYNGMKMDVAKSKHPREFYWDALGIKVTANENQTAAVLSNEKGNTEMIHIPQVAILKNVIYYNGKTITYRTDNGLNEQIVNDEVPIISDTSVIIGMTKTRDSIIIFTTDNNGLDCIWEVRNILEEKWTGTDKTRNLDLIYLRNMGFSTSRPIQIEFNYENENIQKIYWIDSINQIKSLNIRHNQIKGNGEIIDINLDSTNFVGSVSFSQPIVEDVLAGGNHTAGIIQYAYNLYRLNSSQTKISPLSERVSLGKQIGGGEVNEVVGSTPIVKINNIDTSYDSILVYAIKYTSYNQSPAISLIADRKIDTDSLVIYDDGSSISSIGVDEFVFLGSDPLVPQHIATKDSRMFMFNIKTKNFILPDELDMRAYSYSTGNSAEILSNVTIENGIVDGDSLFVVNFNVPYTHDAINADYDKYKYQKGNNKIGGEGKYIKYEIVQLNSTSIGGHEGKRFFKDREIYRIAIQFYNRLGQSSLPIWVADFKTPVGNLLGTYNTLKVELTSAFTDWLNTYSFESEDDRPVGYKILRAERTANDKTIVCQGILSTMMVNSPVTSRTASRYNTTEKRTDSDSQPKLPNILMRNKGTISPMAAASHLRDMNFSDDNFNNSASNTPLTEIAFDRENRKANTYQYNTMYQMYSPEITFENPSVTSNMTLDVIGTFMNTDNQSWLQEREVLNKLPRIEGKVTNGIHPEDTGVTNQPIKGNIYSLMDSGIIAGPQGNDPEELMSFFQFYRQYGEFERDFTPYPYKIYGVPEIVEKGQGRTVYNNDSKYEYSNTLQGFLSDGNINNAIININSEGAKNFTFVLGNDNLASFQRPSWESLHGATGKANAKSIIVAEFKKNDSALYVGSIYGGYNYESKKRTPYLAIGTYTLITDSLSTDIYSPGDTFVDTFKFERISKSSIEIYAPNNLQYTEIVEFPVETTIDLSKRNDNSFSSWDSDFQPRYDDYHKYNTVYSQEADLITETNLDYNQKIVEDFDTRIQATKIKIPNESIDSWTDFLVNDVMDLDGKYGPINAVVNNNDNIFALQDEAVALISINPRVTVSAEDGIPTELGTGAVLSDYNYLTTKSGTINKWSVMSSVYGFYYFDLLNKTWMRVNGKSVEDIVNLHGMNSWFRNNLNYKDLIVDNPILNTGISTGYDAINNTVYISFLQSKVPFTISFNERTNSFISFHSYVPSFYISKGHKMITTNPENNSIYEHDKGEYNTFYDEKYPFYITFQANPPENDNVFTNIIYNAECYLDDVDVPLGSFTHIRAWNEYQNTDKRELILGTNINRKFRKWRLGIPRDSVNKLDRMRGHWIKVKLSYEGDSNYRFIIHNTSLQYIPYSY